MTILVFSFNYHLKLDRFACSTLEETNCGSQCASVVRSAYAPSHVGGTGIGERSHYTTNNKCEEGALSPCLEKSLVECSGEMYCREPRAGIGGKKWSVEV